MVRNRQKTPRPIHWPVAHVHDSVVCMCGDMLAPGQVWPHVRAFIRTWQVVVFKPWAADETRRGTGGPGHRMVLSRDALRPGWYRLTCQCFWSAPIPVDRLNRFQPIARQHVRDVLTALVGVPEILGETVDKMDCASLQSLQEVRSHEL